MSSHGSGGKGTDQPRSNSFDRTFKFVQKFGAIKLRTEAGDVFKVTARSNFPEPRIQFNLASPSKGTIMVCSACWEFNLTCNGKDGTRHNHYSKILDSFISEHAIEEAS